MNTRTRSFHVPPPVQQFDRTRSILVHYSNEGVAVEPIWCEDCPVAVGNLIRAAGESEFPPDRVEIVPHPSESVDCVRALVFRAYLVASVRRPVYREGFTLSTRPDAQMMAEIHYR